MGGLFQKLHFFVTAYVWWQNSCSCFIQTYEGSTFIGAFNHLKKMGLLNLLKHKHSRTRPKVNRDGSEWPSSEETVSPVDFLPFCGAAKLSRREGSLAASLFSSSMQGLENSGRQMARHSWDLQMWVGGRIINTAEGDQHCCVPLTGFLVCECVISQVVMVLCLIGDLSTNSC